MFEMKDPLIFVYVNGNNSVKVQHLTDISHNDTYFQGISLLEYELNKLKTFRKDRILEVFNSIDEATQYIESGIVQGTFYYKEPKVQTFDVCFTGFQKNRKQELIVLAEKAGLTVRKDITVNLQILCCGYNAGPRKMKEARDRGILILDEERFLSFLNTGDVTSKE